MKNYPPGVIGCEPEIVGHGPPEQPVMTGDQFWSKLNAAMHRVRLTAAPAEALTKSHWTRRLMRELEDE